MYTIRSAIQYNVLPIHFPYEFVRSIPAVELVSRGYFEADTLFNTFILQVWCYFPEEKIAFYQTFLSEMNWNLLIPYHIDIPTRDLEAKLMLHNGLGIWQNYWNCTFQTPYRIVSCQKHYQWEVTIGSGNDVMPPVKVTLIEPMLTQSYVAIWRH